MIYNIVLTLVWENDINFFWLWFITINYYVDLLILWCVICVWHFIFVCIVCDKCTLSFYGTALYPVCCQSVVVLTDEKYQLRPGDNI